jgi:DNA-binding MarR family transcriptional regulator
VIEITPNQWTILEAMKDGPRWARSFQTVKPLLVKLIEKGLAERCRPHLGNARNMVRLTLAGCEALEIDPATVPDRIKREPLPPAKTVNLLPINPAASAKSREICEAFVRAVHRSLPALWRSR